MILGRQSGLGKGLGALIPPKGTASPVAPPPVSRPLNQDARPPDAALETVVEPTQVSADGVDVSTLNMEIKEVPIHQIDPNPDQPRHHFDHAHLEDLINSIKEHGIIQPLVVRRLPSGRYQLIAGERRLRAAGIAGLETVPVVVRDVDEEKRLAWAIIENVQRQDLNPVEEAKAYLRLVDEFQLTQEEVAKKMGKSRSYIANATRLLQLPHVILEALINGKITASHARTLLSLASDEERLRLFQSMLEGNFTVRQVEDRVPHTRRPSMKDPNLVAAEDKLREKLHCKVQLIHTPKGTGEVRLKYYSEEELAQLLERLIP